MKEMGYFGEEPYRYCLRGHYCSFGRKEVINIVNLVLGRHPLSDQFWTTTSSDLTSLDLPSLKYAIIEKFGEISLNDKEKSLFGNYTKLSVNIRLQILYWRYSNITSSIVFTNWNQILKQSMD